jgi:hypothetical protein
MLYGIAYLRKHSSDIVDNPTLLASPFVYANQVAIAVSLWCRALESARYLQQDVGHATWGHAITDSAERYGYGSSHGRPRNPRSGIFESSHSRSKSKKQSFRADDEIRLHVVDSRTKYTASIKASEEGEDQPSHQDIEVTRQVWVR